MSTWYPFLKTLHQSLAFTSGGFFLLRGLGMLLGSAVPTRRAVRRLSYLLDSALLLTALLLLGTLHLNPFTTPWLQVKLTLLLAYIGCGMVALHRGRTRGGRALAFALAVTCFLMMVAVARSHDPLGFVR